MIKIEERLPSDFYEKDSKKLCNEFPYNLCSFKVLPDPVFYIPFKDDFPILDSLTKKNLKRDFSLLYIPPKEETVVSKGSTSTSYPLQTMFDCYKESILSYNYNEFKTIVLNELQLNKSDQESLEYFLETFGYEAFDFLTEIIRHRHNSIDYSTPIYSKFYFTLLHID